MTRVLSQTSSEAGTERNVKHSLSWPGLGNAQSVQLYLGVLTCCRDVIR
jgi:hypothetical protein